MNDPTLDELRLEWIKNEIPKDTLVSMVIVLAFELTKNMETVPEYLAVTWDQLYKQNLTARKPCICARNIARREFERMMAALKKENP